MIRADRSTKDQLDLAFPDMTITQPFSNIAGVIVDPASQEMLDAIRDYIYSELDDVVRRTTIPKSDPAKDTDPGEEGLFWRGTGGNAKIVMRPLIVSVAWDGERYQFGFRVPQ